MVAVNKDIPSTDNTFWNFEEKPITSGPQTIATSKTLIIPDVLHPVIDKTTINITNIEP